MSTVRSGHVAGAGHTLGSTLLSLLAARTFSIVSVARLYGVTGIDQVAFCARCGSGFTLLSSVFGSVLVVKGRKCRHERRRGGPRGGLARKCLGILSDVLSLCCRHCSFFRRIMPRAGPCLTFQFCQVLLSAMRSRASGLGTSCSLGCSTERVTKFVYFNLFKFVDRSCASGMPLRRIRAKTERLLASLLRSGVLMWCFTL